MRSTRIPRRHSTILPRFCTGHIAMLAALGGLAGYVRAVDYTVTTATDTGSFLTGVGSGNSGDLRYCISRANANPGSTITMDGLAVMLSTELPPITAPMLIQAMNGTSISGQNNSRIFFIDAPGATVTIQNILLRDGRAKGGNGGVGCGGGGMGAGGAIFVNAGNAVCNNIRVQNMAAVGGNGGATDGGYSGGGGGLGGDGGVFYGGGGGFRGRGGNGFTVTGGVAGAASGGGGGIDGRGADGSQNGGGGGGGTTNGGGINGGGGGGNGGTNFTAKDGSAGATYGGGGGAGTGGFDSARGGDGGRFGGGGGGSSNSNSDGGNGGEFGGGGGGSFSFAGNKLPRGGAGGYGAGGGGGAFASIGGFGGGNGGNTVANTVLNRPTTGGGGSAYGGAIFVRSGNGATLRVINVTLPSGILTLGAAGAVRPLVAENSGAPGSAAGSSVYFNGNGGDFDVTTHDADYAIDGSIHSDANVGLQKNGLRTLTLTAPNFHNGTTVNYGTLKLSGTGTLGNPASFLSTYLSGTCDLNGTNQTVGPIYGTNGGQITNHAPGTTATLIVGNGDTSGDFEAYLRDGAGRLALRKIGSGTQILRHANTHTGLTEVLGGTLVLDTGFSAGPLVPAASTLSISNAAVRLSGTRSNALGQGPIIIGSGGVLSAENAGTAVHHLGPLTLQGGALTGGSPDSGQPNLIIANDVTVNGNAASAITMPRGQILGARSFTVADGPPAVDLTISSALQDHFLYPGGIVKEGPGTLHLTARSTYTAGTVVNGGVLSAGIGGFTGPFPAGSTVTVNNGGTLLCAAGDCLGYFEGNAKIIINTGGTVTTNGAADMFNWLNDLTMAGGTLTSPASGGGFLISGPLKTQPSTVTSVISCRALAIYPGFSSPASFDVPAGTAPGGIDLRISSPIGGGGGEPLIKRGGGVMLLTSANSYQGGTRLEGGTLAISHPDALGTGPIRFAEGALRFDGIAPDISSRIQQPASGAFPIRINTNGQNVTFASPLSGPAPLGKSGTGTLTLSAVCTYTGGTNVNGGTVAVTAAGRLGSGPINIAPGATLDLRAFGIAGYPMPAGTVITNNGTLLGNYYFIGSQPDIAVEQPPGTNFPTGSSMSFPARAVGSAISRTFTLTNSGAGALQIASVGIVSGHLSDFTVNTSGMATNLPANAAANSTTFTVVFNPTAAGNRTAVMRIASSDPDEGTIDITLNGTGFVPPQLTVEYPVGTGLARRTAIGWGTNVNGESTVPASATDIVALSGGRWHTLALNADGSVTGWGYNGDGQINVPADLGPAVAVAAGGYHSMALRADGTLRAWGFGGNGQTSIPAGLGPVIAIAAGERISVAVRQDGTVAVWGLNSNGQHIVPAAAVNVRAVAAGLSHVAALRSDGTVIAWGRTAEDQAVVPAGLTDVTALAAGNDHTLALKRDGTVVAWGWNGSGQRSVPAGLSGVQAIAAGGNHSVALKSDGTVVTWGDGASGMNVVPATATGVTAIAAGWEFNTAARTVFVDMGGQPVGTAGSRSILVRNTGGQTLVLSGIALRSFGAADFTSPSAGQSISILPGAQTTLAIGYLPRSTGVHAGGLTFVTNDPAVPARTIPLRGTGILTPLAAWRLRWFGTIADAGEAADAADPDRDGLDNLTEFAFGRSPASPPSATDPALPSPVRVGQDLVWAFPTPPGSDGTSITAEWSTDAVTWQAVPDTGTPPNRRYLIPATAPRILTRLRVARAD